MIDVILVVCLALGVGYIYLFLKPRCLQPYWPIHTDILNPTLWKSRLSPMRFRRYQPDDLLQCVELYRLNEPGRFPPGMLKYYWEILADQSVYFLVLENDGRIVATGGI